jgi:hypothetical protein
MIAGEDIRCIPVEEIHGVAVVVGDQGVELNKHASAHAFGDAYDHIIERPIRSRSKTMLNRS